MKVPGADEKSRQFNLLFELSEAASLLTLEEKDLSGYWLDQPVDYVAAGFMVRCQRLLWGMECLVEGQLADVATTLARPLIESTVTGEWLLDGGRENLLKLLGNDRHHLRQLQEVEWGHVDSTEFDRAMKAWIDEPLGSSWPVVRERAGFRWDEIEPAYKRANPHVHVSYSAASGALEIEGGERGVEGHVASSVIDLLLDSTVFALRFGKRLHTHFRWGCEGVFDELFEGLGASPSYPQEA